MPQGSINKSERIFTLNFLKILQPRLIFKGGHGKDKCFHSVFWKINWSIFLTLDSMLDMIWYCGVMVMTGTPTPKIPPMELMLQSRENKKINFQFEKSTSQAEQSCKSH